MEPLQAVRTLLSVQNLSVRLPQGMDRSHAVEDISFDLASGEILCIIGESGSGKSVTANTLMGLLPSSIAVSQGQILFNGQNLLACDERTLRGLRGQAISIIFQDPLSALNPLMTLGEQIAETLAVHGVSDSQEQQRRVVQLLTEVGLPDPEQLRHQYPFRLSGGQRQRVMIAMALALDPQLLIADEPTTALDVTTQAQILEMIRTLQRRKGMGVMFITHDFGVVAEIADRVAVMEKGRLVEQGPAAQVLRDPQHPYTRKLLAAVPRMALQDRKNLGQAPVVLKVQDLCKTYITAGRFFAKGRTVKAVDGVSFELRKGRTLGIVGESGSGKSSLGRLLMKLMPSDSGSIHFDGQDICPLSQAAFRPVRRYIQMIFQDPFASLNPRHSIGRILTIGPQEHGVAYEKARLKALKLLKLVGLDDSAFERYPHEFSGGQRQRIGIARALMFDPLVLIADEAVSALDVSIQAQIIELLATVQQETRVAMIFITHDLRVASRICDEVAVIHQGKIVEHGAPYQVFNHPVHAYTQRLLAAVPRSDWACS
ncbi:ABC transporter ATP-binding protein [Pseudomonas sp. dw_358]|uniref:ABC transporter ATP-binding protein n=1 Tax=Pseudomonas sp. dw_358 TaxID=2720083 RepID=UPI001BD2FDDA|nr:ABC transporter ATP-binding protein [Pseudomonas sp. dw_358]